MAERPTPRGGVPPLIAHRPDDLLRRAHAVRLAARRAPISAARHAGAALLRLRRRGAPRATSASAGASAPASTSSTASARPRCCTSSSRTARATCATARPARPCPATRSRSSTRTANRWPPARSATCGSAARPAPPHYWNNRARSLRHLPRPVDAHRRPVHRSTRTATTPTAAAPTTCSRWAASTSRPSRSRPRSSRHDAVLEAAVVGHADEHDLIKPKAFVVLKPGRTAAPALADELQRPREGATRALQVPALDRVRRASCPRPRPARSSASSCARHEVDRRW